MEMSVGSTVMPGDKIIIESTSNNQKIILGPGLRTDGETVFACKAGVLRKRLATYYVESYQKRYVPSQGESVVGVVTQKVGDIFKVDIGGSEQASLSYLAFEGASKRNRPNVQIGDLVYAKLVVASKDMEPELVCVDSFGKKGKLGVLDPNGLLFGCSLTLVNKILKPDCPLFRLLAEELKYELAVGMNGKVWIKSKGSVEDTIAIANAILAAEYVPVDELPALTRNVMKSLGLLK